MIFLKEVNLLVKKVVVATDSFKDSMNAFDACKFIQKGLLKSGYENIELIPLADGGEGTASVLTYGKTYKSYQIEVHNALYEKKNIMIDILDNVAIIETAKICGLEEIDPSKRNPLKTTTYGVGEAVKKCFELGIKEFIVLLGGSATNDGGIGMLQALGAQIKIRNCTSDHPFRGEDLPYLTDIDINIISKTLPLKESRIILVCDVDNPLLGDHGATKMFSKQKGADSKVIDYLEEGMSRYASLVSNKFNVSPNLSMTGSGGGMGYGFKLINAELKKGIDFVLKSINFEERVKDADLIITGEGSIDAQTQHGKVIAGVLDVAKRNNIPVIAFCGKVDKDIDELYKMGLVGVFSIVSSACELNEALKKGKENLEFCVYNVMKVMNLNNY